MPDPVSERIIQNVVTTLQAVTAGANYTNTIAGVVRPQPGAGTPIQDRVLVVFQGAPSPVDWDEQRGREWRHVIKIQGTVIESEDSTTPVDQRINSLRADIEKALLVDINRGGLAITTDILESELSDIVVNANQGQFTVNIEVQYRTAWNDPYLTHY